MKSTPLLVLVFCVGAAALTAQEPPRALESPTADDLARGRKLFDTQCSGCHGIGGTGGRGPSLTRAKLRRAPDDQALVDVLFGGVPGTGMGPAWQLSDRELVQVAAYVRSLGKIAPEELPGDSARGRELFEGKAGCTACHIVHGRGSGLGPDLSDVGARRGGRHLREALLDPGASRPELAVAYEPRSFAAYVVVEAITRDGHEIAGHRVNEDSFTIQIRDADGVLHSLRKASLASLEKPSGASPMPSYRDTLEPADIDDLVAFLATLRGEP
jgi:cytochrome c oxidase cbb3-type subunit III